MPIGSLVIGVDLDPIRPIRGAISVQEDITQPKCRAVVKRLIVENGCKAFDLVLHDGSPNVGGAWARRLPVRMLWFSDSKIILPYFSVLDSFLKKVEVDKPQASCSALAEIYIVCFKYKAPAKIDPQLLDVKHLFQGGKEPPKVVDVLRGTKQERHRDRYEDGDTTLRKVCSAADFVWSNSPLEILGSVTSITFEDLACSPIKDHTLTIDEVKDLCDDLHVLRKQDFKNLIRWRIHIRKSLSPSEKATSATTAVERESKQDEDERILNEMEELTNAMEQKKKRAKKLLAKRRAKGDDDNNMVHSDQDSDNDGDREVNPLVVPLIENAPSQEEIAAKWFSQDVFMDSDEREDLENDDSEDEMQMDLPVKHPEIQEKKIEDSPKKYMDSRTSKLSTVKASKVDDFEIVPTPHTDSSDSSSDNLDEDDINSKAEILACAKKMLTKNFKKKATPKKPKKEYVVAKKGVQVKAGKGKVLVDRRMKKDARKQGMSKRVKETKVKQKGKGSAQGPGKG
ncbi:unnamed protein product [Fraxinus pennsylvanica]|uniref:Uncharacterized protein n=1 Tax=Fraxinus pennsylvanica TaxID=56036 RepID=A0AAD2A5B8_9LAMI|nr:unnamed protein product [Fraxinus pennsylvanica]